MVDLDSVESTKPPPELDEQSAQQLSNKVTKQQLCRLCLQSEDEAESEKSVDIYEEPGVDENGEKVKAVEELLYELFNIKYDKTCLNLPHIICHRCWDMVQAFSSFRSLVQQCEELLQKRLKLLQTNAFLSDNEDRRPGLNGNPGVFVPDEDCEIEEVNPEQDFESSEDDFSMESDSEPEDIVLPVKVNENNSTTNVNTKAVKNVNKKSSPFVNPTAGDVMSSNDLNISKEMPPVNMPLEHMNLEFSIKNTYSCQYCDMSFTTQNDCTDHESRHDPTAPFLCNFCPMRCTTRQALIGHIKEIHDPERPYVCALCNKGFCRRSDLKKHSIVHTGVRPFACPICAKSFSRNTNLTKHMRIHNSIKPYVCKQCPRSFTTGTELLRHGRSHSDVRNFKCSRCTATFARKDKLQMHEQAHYRKESEFLLNQAKQPGQPNLSVLPQSLENMENMVVPINPYANADLQPTKPEELQHTLFPDNQFPKTKQPLHYNKPKSSHHGRIHTCNICSKSFTRERDLHRHQALHLDSLFTCKQCGVGFSRREKLARHELEQHGPQYPCEICRITFHKREELEMHLKMHELQQNAALSAHQAVLNAAGVVHTPMELTQIHHHSVAQSLQQPQPPPLPPVAALASQRPSAADMSFYSNMVPTMNLGFYSETRPEDRNGI
ncbi:zinc finger protein 2 [Lucilia sericata]|uniref:zinc finger protein 2 n=1 Tax=Lucilia sericata TaxID=13632 RepID=UPI0018A86874|nr:zinc finger protein 2 [Lucilia sericata]